MARLIYGVFGYGRGHATRALTVLPTLTSSHDVLVLAGGDAYETLKESYPVLRLPRIGFEYGSEGRVSPWRTLRKNTPQVLDVLIGGATARGVQQRVSQFAPHVAISDAEPWTHRVAASLRIPRVSFDHVGLLAHCNVEIPTGWNWSAQRDVALYRLLSGKAQRVIVSSFFHAEPRDSRVQCVGPLLRQEVHRLRATDQGYLLAYFNHGRHQVSRSLEEHLHCIGRPVLVYGSDQRGNKGQLTFLPPSNDGFLRDLAGASAVLSTAGNQLVGECIHLRKPLLVVPENCFEQHVNAAAVVRLGIGESVEPQALDAQAIRAFLSKLAQYRTQLEHVAGQTRPDGLEALQRSVASLLERRNSMLGRHWIYA